MSKNYQKLIGSIFGSRFEIISLFEDDDIGQIYLGKDNFSNGHVKVRIWNDLSVNKEILKAVQQLLINISLIHHPGIMNIEAIGTTSSSEVYYVLPNFNAESLRKKFIGTKSGTLSPIESVKMIASTTETLKHLHNNGIVHGALHPGAIMIPPATSPDPIRIIDFGLSYIIEESSLDLSGVISESSASFAFYKSPEQLNNQPYDRRADIYTLGAILFEALTGKPPYSGESSLEILAHHLRGEVPQLEIYDPKFKGSPLQKLLNRALAPKAGDRYSDISQFGAALNSLTLDSLIVNPQIKMQPSTKYSQPASHIKDQKHPKIPTQYPKKNSKSRVKDTQVRSKSFKYLIIILISCTILAIIFYIMYKPTETLPQNQYQITNNNQNQKQNEDINVHNIKIQRNSQSDNIKIDPEIISLIRRADEALNSGNNNEAILIYKQVLRRDNRNIRALRNIGIAYGKSGKNNEAIKYLQSYTRENPTASDLIRINHIIDKLKKGEKID